MQLQSVGRQKSLIIHDLLFIQFPFRDSCIMDGKGLEYSKNRRWVMSVYAIGDPHLSLGCDKEMNIFAGWHDYVQRLEQNWRENISP